MNVPVQVEGPFPFTADDLEPERALSGARHTLADFQRWRAARPDLVAAHLDRCQEHLHRMAATPHRRWRRRRSPSREQLAREAAYFLVYDMAEVPDPAAVEACVATFRHHRDNARVLAKDLDRGSVEGVIDALERRFPALRDLPERRWLAERLDRLHRGLPEEVVRAGGMGKVVRTMTGVLAIAVCDTVDDDPLRRRAHFRRVLPGAYAFGATYAVVDDSLQDLPADRQAAGERLPANACVSRRECSQGAAGVQSAERDRCHRMILHGLATGAPIDRADVPDHPLAEELHDLYALALDLHPFGERRHLYRAAEAMYLAQHRDAALTAAQPPPGGLDDIYPDVFLKAGLSRVVANILGRREVPRDFYARCLNTIFVSQFKDDLIDREEDGRAGRLTPFTLPPQSGGGNPLEDMLAYEAYAAAEVFGGNEIAADALSWFGSLKLATHLSGDPRRCGDLLRSYRPGGGVSLFLRTAAQVPHRATAVLAPVDMTLKQAAGRALSRRDPGAVDPRTFVLDRIPAIEESVRRFRPPAPTDEVGGLTEVDDVIAYALEGGGKRLRPGLTLMLAEALSLAYHRIEPVLAASELFHTASLLFDDLPAQDDATLRRGRPAAHRVFGESSVQLAGIALLSAGFGALATLDRHHPAATVTEIIGYAGAVLGPRRLCRGQAMDLEMSARTGVTTAEILQMYALKTATMIEAALVPVMMLTCRPETEIEEIKQYAHHAGIVFQIRDDLLDATAAAERIGKDAGHDTGKANLVRLLGVEAAERIMQGHVDAALTACAELPFDTRLLEASVRHFATRRL